MPPDTTTKHNDEAGFADARTLLAAVVKCSDDVNVTKTLNGVNYVVACSRNGVFGHTEKEAIGQPITMLIPSDRLEEEQQIPEQLRAGKRIEHY